jgi:hypothetical protein
VLQQAGLKVAFFKAEETCQNLRETVILTYDNALFAALDDLIFRASDVHAYRDDTTLSPLFRANPKPAAVVVISRRAK